MAGLDLYAHNVTKTPPHATLAEFELLVMVAAMRLGVHITQDRGLQDAIAALRRRPRRTTKAPDAPWPCHDDPRFAKWSRPCPQRCAGIGSRPS